MRIINSCFYLCLLALGLVISPSMSNAQHIFSPEDITNRDIPSTPPPSKTPTPIPSLSPSPSPSPSASVTVSPSPSPSPSMTQTPSTPPPSPTPTPTLPPTTPSTPPPTPTTPPPTPTPTPTPTPKPLCEYFAIDLHRTNLQGDVGGFDPLNYQEIRALGTSSATGACLNSKLDEALQFCSGTNGVSVNNSGDGYLDDCVMEVLMGPAFVDSLDPQHAYYLNDIDTQYDPNPAKRRLLKSELPKNYGFAKSCVVVEFKGGGFKYSTVPSPNNSCAKDQKYSGSQSINSIYEGKVYFDSNCQSVNFEPVVLESCREDMYYRASPISLIWEDANSLEEKTLVKFELDKSKPHNSYCEWKASAKAPLLVYDPEHTGKVTGAHQLFGDWTFGGKQLASLSSGMILSSKWENGYEALASLDRNKSESVEGEELKELALWFDENKNGISEPGEVIALTKLDITTLYFRNPVKDASNQDLFLTKGFERLVNNRIIHGKTVDWYSNTYQNPTDAIANNLSDRDPNAPEVKIIKPESSVGKESYQDKAISGIWNWKSAIDTKINKDTFGGILILDAHDDTFEGISLSERELPGASAYGKMSEASMYRMYGKKLAKGSYLLTANKDGNTIETYIQIVKNGLELEGKTTILNRNGSLSYNWVAQRK